MPQEIVRKILQVTFSSAERERVAAFFRNESPRTELLDFPNSDELKSFLASASEQPWLILAEGPETLEWLKRHPKFHFTPVIVNLAGAEPDLVRRILSAGAFGCVQQGADTSALSALLVRLNKINLQTAELAELDQLFLEELVARTSVCREYLAALTPAVLSRLYHAFHTVKGSARTLEFPVLSGFMHQAESFLEKVREKQDFSNPLIPEIGHDIVEYLDQVAESIAGGSLIPLPGEELLKKILEFGGTGQEARIVPGVQRESGHSGAESWPGALAGSAPAEPVQTGPSQSVRISVEKVDQLEKTFRRILAVRVRMSRFAHQLKTEFYDERFPDDLVALTDELQQENSEILELLAGLRLVPVLRLKAFAERVLFEATVQLAKVARLDFISPAQLAVEQKIFDCLENASLHLIRNAVDHGLESAEIRARIGKEAIGRIGVEVREFGPDKIMAVFEDDGAGIDIEAIKRAVFKRGASIGAVLEKMKPQEIAQLVFTENFSSKEELTEISGRGVGLSSVKQQISELGGIIELYFEEGKGCRFTLILPKIFRP